MRQRSQLYEQYAHGREASDTIPARLCADAQDQAGSDGTGMVGADWDHVRHVAGDCDHKGDAMTDEHILQSLLVQNPNATERDVAAARRFMRCFDCEDSEIYTEAKERILASMDMMNDAIDHAPDDFTACCILRERLAKL